MCLWTLSGDYSLKEEISDGEGSTAGGVCWREGAGEVLWAVQAEAGNSRPDGKTLGLLLTPGPSRLKLATKGAGPCVTTMSRTRASNFRYPEVLSKPRGSALAKDF